MRGHSWLKEQLNLLLKKYFTDISLANPIEINFGREAKYRFGSIRLWPSGPKKTPKSRLLRGFGGQAKLQIPKLLKKKTPAKSVITITSMFAKEDVPTLVVQYTIAHELCHYVHGFSSSNRRLFKYPHHGGIVNKELTNRGAGQLTVAFKKWLKIYRGKILKRTIKV